MPLEKPAVIKLLDRLLAVIVLVQFLDERHDDPVRSGEPASVAAGADMVLGHAVAAGDDAGLLKDPRVVPPLRRRRLDRSLVGEGFLPHRILRQRMGVMAEPHHR